MNYFKFSITILILFIFNTTFSQKKELYIEYDLYFKGYYPEERQISVIANYKESLSTITRIIMYRERGADSAKPTSFYKYFFKTKDSVIYKETIGKAPYFIKESLNQFTWKLTGNSKLILKYKCQEATATYRGRDYIAYFTTKIPFKAAPWKFNGLPGVVLAVKTTDDRINIEANALQIKPISGELKNPYSDIKKFTTWIEFKKKYIKSHDDFRKKFQSRVSLVGENPKLMGGPRIGNDLRMEIIVEGNDGEGNHVKYK